MMFSTWRTHKLDPQEAKDLAITSGADSPQNYPKLSLIPVPTYSVVRDNPSRISAFICECHRPYFYNHQLSREGPATCASFRRHAHPQSSQIHSPSFLASHLSERIFESLNHC